MKTVEVRGLITNLPPVEKLEPRTFEVYRRGEDRSKAVCLDTNHPAYEPFSFPLLFPYGESGWGIDSGGAYMRDQNGKRISCLKYTRMRYFQDRRFNDPLLGSVVQEWAVNQFVRFEENQLSYQRYQVNESVERVAAVRDIRRAAETGERVGKLKNQKLRSSLSCSPSYFRNRFHDTMGVVSRLGFPNFFITLTCNPNWPEIKDNMHRGQNSDDLTALINRVFKIKLNKVIRAIQKDKIFGVPVYHVFVIEFQKRGLPHAHLIVKVQRAPNPDDVVRTDIPDKTTHPELYELVTKHMIHGPCGPIFSDMWKKSDTGVPPCWENGACKHHYPKKHTEETHTDEWGHIQYRRRGGGNTAPITRNGVTANIDNSFVVPYNPLLLKLWGGHVNFEIASQERCIKYLFKYVYKGPDLARITILQEGEEREEDEISRYSQTRYISSSEAFWRILEFPVSEMAPGVIRLPVHGSHDAYVTTFTEGREAGGDRLSELDRYFQRPRGQDMDKLTYLDYYESFSFSRTNLRTGGGVHDGDGRRVINRRAKVVARMYWIPFEFQDLFFCRLLLAKRPARSYEELRTVSGTLYSSYEEAARAWGLLDDENEYTQCMRESVCILSAKALRKLFVTLICFGPVSVAKQLWDEFYDFLTDDFKRRYRGTNDEGIMQMVLLDLKDQLEYSGKSLSDFGLREPHLNVSIDELLERFRWRPEELFSFTDEHVKLLSNDEQLPIYDRIIDGEFRFFFQLFSTQYFFFTSKAFAAVRRGSQVLEFIDGPAGTGKTLLLRCITATIRASQKIVYCCAPTGIAALNHDGGRVVVISLIPFFYLFLPHVMYGYLVTILPPKKGVGIRVKYAHIYAHSKAPHASSPGGVYGPSMRKCALQKRIHVYSAFDIRIKRTLTQFQGPLPAVSSDVATRALRWWQRTIPQKRGKKKTLRAR